MKQFSYVSLFDIAIIISRIELISVSYGVGLLPVELDIKY